MAEKCMYKKVDTSIDFTSREKEILKMWKEKDIFNKITSDRDESNTYTFYDGPPTANGMPHIGHVMTRSIKDLIPRFHAMKGKYPTRKAGWDTHGLPVELEIEKKLNINGKDQIENYGLEPFIKECRESVWKYKGLWEEFSDTVAYWADMSDPYITYDNDYIESVWWSLKEIYKKGLLYKGFKIVPYCSRCGTPLSTHEVAQGYKDVKEKSVIAKFKLKNKENEFFLAWTTTPWTLPSNVSLCVNPNEEYVKVKVQQEDTTEIYILAKELVDSVIKTEYDVIECVKGKDLEYIEYEPLYTFAKIDKKAYYVTCDDYVTLTDGTGIVHNAPAFGEDDYRVSMKYELPFIQLVDGKGEFKEEAGKFSGIFIKKADPLVIQDLEERGLLFEALNFEHSYPHCWRCKTPLMYYARESWFIKMTAVKDDLIKNNNTINWVPASIGKGRFGDWIENVQDWSISRDRYWGTPLNIWICNDCGEQVSIGSRDELRELSGYDGELELHVPYIDKIECKCKKCNGTMKRTKEVIDCWYDSGAMPFAQWHYPFENKDKFEKNFPADFISEGVDQTRGWFYSLLAISTLIFNKSPFKNCVVMGHVLDKYGKKMSKSIGNTVDPFEALEQHGADAIRFYFYSGSAPWIPNRYSDDGIAEIKRKVMGTLLNTYAFFVLYADIDKFNRKDYDISYDKLNVMDKWLLSRLNTFVKFVDDSLEEFKITEAARGIIDFIDELSNWYVRRSRERFWGSEMTDDKVGAFCTLYDTLVTVSKVIAPFMPYLADEIYTNLTSMDENAKESVHLCLYPEYNENLVDKELERKMGTVLLAVNLGRSCRNKANIKNRQPLSKIYLKVNENIDDYLDVIKEELNVKEVILQDDLTAFTNYTFKPQLKTLGRRFGKNLNELKEKLLNLDSAKEYRNLEENGYIEVEVAGVVEKIEKDDLLIEAMKTDEYISASATDIIVVLDVTLNDELIKEGLVREVISKVQASRKEADFNVIDKIILSIVCDKELENVIKEKSNLIKSEVLASDIVFEKIDGFSKEFDINGKQATITVKK